MIHSVSATFTGNSVGEIGSKVRGRVLAVKAVADANVTNAYDIALSGGTTGIPILTDTTIANNSTVWWHPRALPSKVADGSDGTDPICEIPLVGEPIACAITNAGATGVITVTVIYDTFE